MGPSLKIRNEFARGGIELTRAAIFGGGGASISDATYCTAARPLLGCSAVTQRWPLVRRLRLVLNDTRHEVVA
jgi:hypothetical protein